ncbi:MAG: hypothetical protein R2864_09690 [Syntrophotaleaceae bacterium]
MSDRVFIDGHAHWHDTLGPAAFLDAARRNFRRAGGVSASGEALQGVLCLADFSGAEGWSRLSAFGDDAVIGAWQLRGGDQQAMLATHQGGDRLWLVAGRQAVTAEKLEVMALGTARPILAGLPLEETLRLVRDLGALPVLPWGAGKWWGRRGRLVEGALGAQAPPLLGDNGGRPWCWRPLLLSRARRHGGAVLPGSDPLPVASDRQRNGSYGLVMKGASRIGRLPRMAAGAGRPIGGVGNFSVARWASPPLLPVSWRCAEKEGPCELPDRTG